MLNRKSKQLKQSTDSELVATFIKACQSLVGVTKTDFVTLYETLIHTVIQFLRKPNARPDNTIIAPILESTLIALKKRRGYFLPLGADSEVVFRERELWTYAVFSASLINGLATNAKAELAKALLPVAGYNWLHRHPALFEQWSHFLAGNSDGNIFAGIIDTNNTTVVIDDKHHSTTHSSTENKKTLNTTTTESVLSDSEKIKATLPDNTVIQELTIQSNETIQETPPANRNESVGNTETETIIALPDFTANDFFHWLRLAIDERQLSINEESSLLYRVHEGFLLLLPELLDNFLQTQAEHRQLPTTCIKTSDKTKLTKHIKKHPSLIVSNIGERFYTYCIGQWQERNTRFGIVVNFEQLADSNNVIPIHSALALDPVDNQNRQPEKKH